MDFNKVFNDFNLEYNHHQDEIAQLEVTVNESRF